ncbi:MAG: hypothetical protein PHV34_20910 [Verrucomicrobiae bacterium]|nr:hypothetical protein [Verrucomicrobiae bacterium]
MPESEWQTRKQRIDQRLKSLSPAWKIVPFSENLDLFSLRFHAVTEFPTETGRFPLKKKFFDPLEGNGN